MEVQFLKLLPDSLTLSFSFLLLNPMHALRLTPHTLHLTCTLSFAFLLLNPLHSPPDPNLAMSSYPIRPHLHTQKTTLRNASPGLLARVTAGAGDARWSSAGAPAAGGSGSKRKGFCVTQLKPGSTLALAVWPTKGWVKAGSFRSEA